MANQIKRRNVSSLTYDNFPGAHMANQIKRCNVSSLTYENFPGGHPSQYCPHPCTLNSTANIKIALQKKKSNKCGVPNGKYMWLIIESNGSYLSDRDGNKGALPIYPGHSNLRVQEWAVKIRTRATNYSSRRPERMSQTIGDCKEQLVSSIVVFFPLANHMPQEWSGKYELGERILAVPTLLQSEL
ncbi:disease resistance protein [Dorcoceras hygrometricum]|uniref:Disease resistance protein n=1 Tax=Dorcoceras hygrometricum TaxID=472368 RepID=A0A2Z7B086_9LAMI|nr:disease resistance protein [Dorcoceras hygrometricum]